MSITAADDAKCDFCHNRAPEYYSAYVLCELGFVHACEECQLANSGCETGLCQRLMNDPEDHGFCSDCWLYSNGAGWCRCTAANCPQHKREARDRANKRP